MDNSFSNGSNYLEKSISTKFLLTNYFSKTIKKKSKRMISLNEFRDKLKTQGELNNSKYFFKQSVKDQIMMKKSTRSSPKNSDITSIESILNTEKDIHLLTSMYHFMGGEISTKYHDKINNKLSSDDRRQILKKYKLYTNVDDTERIQINNMIRTDSNFRKTATSFKSSLKGDQYFKDPYNSLEKLKLNKKIVDQYSILTTEIKNHALTSKIKEV